MGNAVSSSTAAARWPASYETFARRVRELDADDTDEAKALVSALGVDVTAGGFIFWSGLTITQGLQFAARISASTPIAPSVVGAIAVAVSSVAAVQCASLPREIYEDITSPTSSLWRSRSRQEVTFATLSAKAREHWDARVDTLRDAPISIYATMGLLGFLSLGGRLLAVAPSNVADLGAFHSFRASVGPATEEYATSAQRATLTQFGRRVGCHTCGTKRGVDFHADHMPPKHVAELKNRQWLRRLLRRPITVFQFYPQCQPCSSIQSGAVRNKRTVLKLHVSSLRKYHTTGAWLVVLGVGVLSAGSSMLRSINNREATLRQQRRTTSNPRVAQGIDAELRYLARTKEMLHEIGINR